MARFDVYRTRAGELVVDCQADLLSHLESRFVVPLIAPEAGLRVLAKLNPSFEIDGIKLIFFAQYATTMSLSEMGSRITSLAEQDYEISGALEMLLVGF